MNIVVGMHVYHDARGGLRHWALIIRGEFAGTGADFHALFRFQIRMDAFGVINSAASINIGSGAWTGSGGGISVGVTQVLRGEEFMRGTGQVHRLVYCWSNSVLPQRGFKVRKITRLQTFLHEWNLSFRLTDIVQQFMRHQMIFLQLAWLVLKHQEVLFPVLIYIVKSGVFFRKKLIFWTSHILEIQFVVVRMLLRVNLLVISHVVARSRHCTGTRTLIITHGYFHPDYFLFQEFLQLCDYPFFNIRSHSLIVFIIVFGHGRTVVKTAWGFWLWGELCHFPQFGILFRCCWLLRGLIWGRMLWWRLGQDYCFQVALRGLFAIRFLLDWHHR